MRLNKYIAHSGVCSRRAADELIAAGKVSVNGALITEPGLDVADGDKVYVSGRLIEPVSEMIYIALNKPVGYITSVSDDRGRPTVLDLITDINERLYPVGRLDYNTSGLLLLTNDGEFANRLSHPSHEIPKTYRARVAGSLSEARLAKLRRGVDIGGFITSPAEVEIVRFGPRSTIADITIHEGKNRQVRKMFAAVGNNVQELCRTAIGTVKLGRLREGDYRKLTRAEIDYLKNYKEERK